MVILEHRSKAYSNVRKHRRTENCHLQTATMDYAIDLITY